MTKIVDVTLNLTTGKYQPYSERDNNPLYINILPNHTSNIIKNLPSNISKGLKITFQQQKDISKVMNNTKNRKMNGLAHHPILHLKKYL